MDYKNILERDIPNKTALWLLAVIIASFIGIHSLNLTLSISDENTYFYMGNLIAQGSVPYKDFFYAHPPLNIFIIALLIKLFSLNFTILKLVPVITTTISAILVYLISKNLHSKLSGLIAVILFLFAYETLRVSTHLTGIDIATMLLLLAIYFLFKENKSNKSYLYSGIFIGIAGISALFSLIAAVVIGIILLLKPKNSENSGSRNQENLRFSGPGNQKISSESEDFFGNKKHAVYFLIGFSLIFLVINIILILLFGQSYTTPVVKYHFLKPLTGSSLKIIFNILVKENWLLVISALLFIFAKDKKRISALVIITLAYLLFLMTYKSLFGYYLFIILPLLAIIGSYSIFSSIERLKMNLRIILIAIFVIIGIASALSINQYLNYKFQDFNNAREIASYIATNTNSNTMLFGDDSTTPLLALLSNRKIAFNHADLNNFRWRTGLVDIQQTINDIKAEKPLIVTLQVNIPSGSFQYGIDYIDDFHNFLAKDCKVVKEFKDIWQIYEKVVKLWSC